MITKKNFIEMIDLAEKFDSEITRWSDFGIDVFDLPISEIPWGMFTNWVHSNFDHVGQDWIDWYLWERKSIVTGEILACFDENDNEFYVKTPTDLWNLVQNHVLLPCVDSGCQLAKRESCTNS
jgi:hypothetical protein